MNYVYVNGKIVDGGRPVLMANNKSFRYGDGLFETMKIFQRKILLQEHHFERFFESLKLLQIETPPVITSQKLSQEILELCDKNNCGESGRVRLSAYRGNGSIYDGDNALNYIIECQSLDKTANSLNENGLVIGLYEDARKSCDKFSNLKSANYLPYVMAARYAKERNLDDCLLLNVHDCIADTTIANVFIIKSGKLITPGLSEGCVNGVMRKYLIEKYRSSRNEVLESRLTQKDIEDADEVFLTNAIFGIKWVKKFQQKTYVNSLTKKIYNEFIEPLWS